MQSDTITIIIGSNSYNNISEHFHGKIVHYQTRYKILSVEGMTTWHSNVTHRQYIDEHTYLPLESLSAVTIDGSSFQLPNR